MMAVEIPLTRGYVALVDPEDAERVLAHRWRALIHGPRVYACRSGTSAQGCSNTVIYLHRFILGLAKGDRCDVDHRDRNCLNNQRGNLRIATRSENNVNRGPTKNKYGYRGVCWIPINQYFYGQIKKNGRGFLTKGFDTPEEAARAYDDLALKHYGQFAVLNFPDDRATLPEPPK